MARKRRVGHSGCMGLLGSGNHLWCIQLKRMMKSAPATAGRSAASSGALPTSAMLACGRRRFFDARESSAKSWHSLRVHSA